MNRPISALLEQAGFRLAHLTAGHMKRGTKPMTFLYEGSVPRLSGLFEGAFDEGEAALGLFAQKFFLFAAFA